MPIPAAWHCVGVPEIEQALLEWLEANRQSALLLVPSLAFAEACFGIGLLVSGAFLLVVATTLYTSGLAGIQIISMLAFTGAFLGDQAGFYIGRWLGPRLHRSGVATRYQSQIDKAESLIRRVGFAAVFIGRFVPAIRSLIPAMLGLSGFNRAYFAGLDILACALWAGALAAIVLGLDLGFSVW